MTVLAAGSVDITLVFPPIWYYPLPPHELASLTAYLRSRGWRTRGFDFNLDASLYFLSESFLTGTQSLLLREWAELSRRERLSGADGERLALLAKVLASGAHAIPAAAGALDTFRSEAFYDLNVHRGAVRTLHQLWEGVSAAHSPAQLGLGWFRTNRHDEQTWEGCLAAARDPSCNPFVAYARTVAVPRVLAENPRCIAFIYVHPDQLVPMATLLVALRDAGYDGHITVTGNLEDQVTFGRYLRHDVNGALHGLGRYLDSVVFYDAEAALSTLVGTVAGRACPVDVIPNVGFFRGDTFVGPSSYVLTDLDDTPPPDYEDLELDRYLFPERVVSLLGSRGCYWDRCTFCAITTNHLRFRHRSAGRLVEDLRRLVGAHGVGWVHFRDMLFSPAHARRLSAVIIEHGLQVRWTCRARFEDGFTTDMLATMAQAGCAQIWFGLESASQRVLNLMEKGTRVESASRIIASCHSVGIGVHALVMHGFPTESEDEAQETVAFLEERRDAIDSVTYTEFLLFAGTPVHKDPGRFGLTVFDRPDRPLQRDLAYATDRPSTRASYAALKSRLDESFETGLLHPAHVSIFRSRRPARAPVSTGPQESAASLGGTPGPPPGQWRARTSWLGATWDIAALRDASIAPTRRNCVLVSQTGAAGFVQLDCAETADIGPTAGTVDDLIRVLGGRDVVRETPAPVVDGLRALSAAGYLTGDGSRSTT